MDTVNVDVMPTAQQCLVTQCPTPAKNDFCPAHREVWQNLSPADQLALLAGDLPPKSKDACKIEGCSRTKVAKGLCTTHYQQTRRKGVPRKQVRRRSGDSLKLILTKVRLEDVVLDDAKIRAKKEKKSLSEWVEEAIKAHLTRGSSVE